MAGRSQVCAYMPGLPSAILHPTGLLLKPLWLPAPRAGLEAGVFNACKTLYLSVAPFIPALERLHHNQKSIISS